MSKKCRATEFLVGLTFVGALLALIYSFVLMSMQIVDWAIFLLVIGFVGVLFLGMVFLVPTD